jgi:hypothetical protein
MEYIDIVGIVIIVIVAALLIWALWGKVPWKTIGKIVLTLIIVGIAIAMIVGI